MSAAPSTVRGRFGQPVIRGTEVFIIGALVKRPGMGETVYLRGQGDAPGFELAPEVWAKRTWLGRRNCWTVPGEITQ